MDTAIYYLKEKVSELEIKIKNFEVDKKVMKRLKSLDVILANMRSQH